MRFLETIFLTFGKHNFGFGVQVALVEIIFQNFDKTRSKHVQKSFTIYIIKTIYYILKDRGKQRDGSDELRWQSDGKLQMAQ